MTLIEIEDTLPNWVLDRQTREVGLKGIAIARAVLKNKADADSPKLMTSAQLNRTLHQMYSSASH